MMNGTRFFVRRKEAEPEKPKEVASQQPIEALLGEQKKKPGELSWLAVWDTIIGLIAFAGIGYLVYKFITEVL